jgi:hypothetical protein
VGQRGWVREVLSQEFQYRISGGVSRALFLASRFRDPVASSVTLGVLWNYKKRKEHINVVFPGFKRNNLADFLQALAFGLCSVTQ